MIDNYVYVMVALLPLSALILVFQVNPYYALVIRAILGAVAVLVYGILGGGDVALTEALVGTMLAVTLYVIAVRSSLVMRLGITKDLPAENQSDWVEFVRVLNKAINKSYLRLELISYANAELLAAGLETQEVHAICTLAEPSKVERDRHTDLPLQSNSNIVSLRDREGQIISDEQSNPIYQISIRVKHLWEIMQTELTASAVTLNYVPPVNSEARH